MWSRLLLLAYPRWFRREFGRDVTRYLERQRAETRYRAPLWGPARFFWHTGTDALITGVSLRLGGDGSFATGLARRGSARTSRPLPGRRPVRRGRRATNMLEALARDLRDAVRGLRNNPAYTMVFVVTLALGIGANTAIFSVVNGVLLRPLPHRDGDRLVYLRHSARLAGIPNALFSVPEIDDYRRGARSLAQLAEFSALSFTMLGYESPRRVRAGIVTGNYFEVMGLQATLGRAIGPEDDGPGAPAVIAASDAYWRNVLGADPEIVGKTVEINGRIGTFVGVVQPAPPYPERTDIYVNLATSPHHLGASMADDRTHRMTEVFARLAPGATVEAARAELDAITARLHAEYTEAYDPGTGFEVSITSLKSQLTERARPALLTLLATATLVLIIACANLANLTLTRVLRRDHELAIRASLGGSRLALRRALLVESLLLSGAGAVVGMVLASMALDLLVAFAERFTARAAEITLDAPVFAYTLVAAMAASAFFTLLPPLPDGDRIGGGLSSGGSRSTATAGARRAQRALVVAQIATSFVLLIGAGLLLRTVLHLTQLDPGFDQEQVLSMDIPPVFGASSEADVRAKYEGILEDLRGVPGVQRAALTSAVPLTASTFSSQMEFEVDGHEPAAGAPTPRAEFRVVSAGYFAAMGIELRQGREFVSTDVFDAAPVVVVNESMARAYFGDRSPLGQRVAWTDDNFRFLGVRPEWRTIVGVVADTLDSGLDADVSHVVYTPYGQVTPFFTGSLIIRASTDPSVMLGSIRDVILARDPQQPISNVATLADRGSDWIAPRRLNAILLGVFAVLALVIAAVGIGGVLAFSVGSRTREFGIRSALGAARYQVGLGVLAEGAALAGIGVALGMGGAVLLAGFMSGLLVGVPSLDPLTFVAVGVLLAVVAVGAAWLPAWRAARVSPVEALAGE